MGLHAWPGHAVHCMSCHHLLKRGFEKVLLITHRPQPQSPPQVTMNGHFIKETVKHVPQRRMPRKNTQLPRALSVRLAGFTVCMIAI